MIKAYYYLAKPGIIYGNAITTIAGFLLASKGHIDVKLFLAALIGISLVIGAGCVFNNLADRDIDEKMTRTKNRALVTGQISKRNAIMYGVILLTLGLIALNYHTNQTTLLVALTGFIVYVFIYTPMKPRSMHATLVGSIAGAVPPVVGYTAVTNHLDTGAWVLFIILVTWQMPHFYAIAIRRLHEYQAAHIPVLPAIKGIKTTKYYVMCYVILFIIATTLLTKFGYTGYVYLFVVGLAGLLWLKLAIKGFEKNTDDIAWAKKMFKFSLVVLLVFSVMISIGSLLGPPRT